MDLAKKISARDNHFMFIVVIQTIIAAGGAVIFVITMLAFVTGAPYVRMPRKVRAELATMVQNHGCRTVLDIGSGDGVVLRACAKRGILGFGWETNIFLVWMSRLLNGFFGISDRVRIDRMNVWKHPFPAVDCITLYGLPSMNKKLSKKMLAQLPPDTKIFSVTFPLDLPLQARRGKIFFYRISS